MARESTHRAKRKAANLEVRLARGAAKAKRKAERLAGERRRWFEKTADGRAITRDGSAVDS